MPHEARRRAALRPGKGTAVRLEVLQYPAEVEERAAAIIAERSRTAYRERGRFTIALSGGPNTAQMISCLRRKEVPWGKVFVFEVSEPIPPAGHLAVYFPKLREALVEDTPIDPGQIYPMPVSSASPLVAISRYTREIEQLAGSPSVIDLIYLVLETDGCTIKLVASDPTLQVTDGDVGIGVCQGQERMTLTYPVFNRARQILWVVTGNDKAKALFQLGSAAHILRGSRARFDRGLILADYAVMGTREPALRKVQ